MLVLTMQAATNASSCKVVVRAGPPVVELPLHLTEKILCSLSPLASARHATVCKSWASTISARLARPVPHLFACVSPDNTSGDRRGLVVSVPLHYNGGGGAAPTTIPARVRSSDTNGLRCIGATPGTGRVAFAAGWWSENVVLVNPVTGALDRVHVGDPCRLDPRHSRVLASDSFFAVDGYGLTLWRRRNEEAWWRCAVTATSSPSNSIVSAVECNGCFYLLRQDGCLATVDAAKPPPLRMEKLAVESLIMPHQLGSSSSVNKTEDRLLETDGEVLLVRQLLACKEQVEESCVSSLSVAGFEVYRLDVKQQRWTKVNELRADRALFVSPGSSFAVCASEVEGCSSNCIYFVGESQYHSGSACREGGDSSWGMYSMEERRVVFEHVVVTDEPGRGAELFWFLPRLV